MSPLCGDDTPDARAALGAPVVEVCLVLVHQQRDGVPHVLLGEKRRGFGRGRIVLPGGKIHAEETPAETAARELHEETGLIAEPQALRPAALLDFSFPHSDVAPMRARVFRTSAVRGHAVDSDEITVLWVPEDAIPYARMWPDAAHWLPQVLTGTATEHAFRYGPDNSTVEDLDQIS